jgi:hypothetical protein
MSETTAVGSLHYRRRYVRQTPIHRHPSATNKKVEAREVLPLDKIHSTHSTATTTTGIFANSIAWVL